jgi:ABC-type polysaccharide/polyol phosphate export permease
MSQKQIYISMAANDLVSGLRRSSLWWALSLNEIRQRYRRSLLGPFWLSLSMLIMVVALGLIYGQLFNMDIKIYIPFLATGLVIWNFGAFLINEGCQTFIASSSYMKQLAMPKSVFAFQVVARNFLVFAHNVVIVVVMLIYFNVRPHYSALYTVPLGLILIMMSGLSAAIVLGGLSARYRDISQIVASVMQVLFFVTPVMFRGDMLKNHEWLMTYNPFFYYLEFIRRPLLGEPAPAGSLVIVSLMAIASVTIALVFLARFQKRITYWV